MAKISNTMLQEARDFASAHQVSLWDALIQISHLEPRHLLVAVATLFDMRIAETADMLACEPAFDLLPLNRAMQKQCVILRDANKKLLGIISDAFDPDAQVFLNSAAKSEIQFCLALNSDIQAYLSRQEESAKTTDGLVSSTSHEKRESKAATKLSYGSISEATSPAVKLVNATLYDALKAGASDVHLESTPQGLAVKYRIDGVLDHITSTTGISDAEQVISRLKVLAELDISERRVPQDGSFCIEVNDREIDLRLSIMPSIHGEDAVIRILDKQAMVESYGALSLEALGFDEPSLVTLRMLTEEAYGMLLVTGPTGSGKTTTLYAALSEIHNGREKIITIEDPVEYQLPGILQIPVNEKKGLTFAKGLRSILRHDPDKIMVGEIRDQETAEIAVQSALTGHLVLTTVHANNVFDVFGRFSHMGIDPYAFVSALNGIWAQRLVRINCPHCSVTVPADENMLKRVNLTLDEVQDFHFRKGSGCGDCRGTGYKGRRAIAEILTLTDEIREMIIEKRPIRQIKDAARRNGTTTLREAALAMVQRGETTLEEIKRITLHA
ncbi:type II/IV secretion system protein [Undibacterium sp. CY18W]|uniref:Type II/IV secretion system protein n=2 Tax=Undibacterium hunanense TaxID=2762292 RepID=A0ABR6ZKD2_9BURK|nr:GspE/PulE family protein [Undibacterium hunanense]MBC3915998.1 type II/IV secretion system protein [Undibacterium hunanense]